MPPPVPHEPIRGRSIAAAIVLLSAAVGAPAAAATLDVLVTDERGRPMEHAVVWVLAGLPHEAPPNTVATIDQVDRRFAPDIVAVQTGTWVAFPNGDDVRHHVYSFSKPNDFQIELYHGEPGQNVHFEHPGLVTLGCNIHDGMVGHIVVVDTPLFAVTGADGHASIADVPEGGHALKAWHPDTGERLLGVDVPPGAERASTTIGLVSQPSAAQPANPLQGLFSD